MIPHEGHIQIQLQPARQRGVSIHSSRLLAASQLMLGKTADQVMSLVPLLYNICGMSQASAAAQALANAAGDNLEHDLQKARDILVLAETAREHLARIFIDWPTLFSLEAPRTVLPGLGQLLPRFRQHLFLHGQAFGSEAQAAIDQNAVTTEVEQLEDLLSTHVFGIPVTRWLEQRQIEDVIDWYQHSTSLAARVIAFQCEQGWASQGANGCAALPEIPPALIAEQLASETAQQFIAQPQWQQAPAETNSFTRQQQHPLIVSAQNEFADGLLTRTLARLVELARIPAMIRQALQATPTDRPASTTTHKGGLGQVEAARGRLIHWAELDDGKVRNYQILAPTEWNFHPQGLVARALGNIQAKDDAEKLLIAKLLINAIDPCVQCSPEIVHA